MFPSAAAFSRTSAAAAARHAGRRSSAVMRDAAAGNIRCTGGSHVRALASSPFPDLPLPDSIREAVKSSVLEEAARPDSSFWRGDDSDDEQQVQMRRQQMQQEHTGRREEGTPSHDIGRKIANGIHHRVASINDPIAHDRQKTSPPPTPPTTTNDNLDPHPLIHFDPLDEWHLDRVPSLPLHSLPAGVRPLTDGADPFALAKSDLDTLSASIRRDLIGRDHADHPVLAKAAAHFFELGAQGGGKKVRPMMVMLLSRAMASCDGGMAPTPAANNTVNGTATATCSLPPPQPKPWQRQDLPDAQRRLAEISEMIHTASLFHDDVIDGADTRRGAPAVHRVFGNKMAILAGDYLLARASIYLARLRDVEVVETMSTIIEHLVRGEVMQSHGGGSGSGGTDGDVSKHNDAHEERMVYYLRKNFYKTGSLMANSCKSAALLGGYDDAVVHAAYCYGKHVGSAFQLVDDVLDFDGSSSTMGKASLADLNAGLATAPVLFAAERFPDEMDRLIDRKFGEIGDVNRAVELVRQSDGIQRTKDLAHVYVELAIDAVMELEPSPYRDSLIHLAYKVIDRVR